jgi:acetyl esterase/lipase
VALGIPPARIVLAGESQGGALALLAALSCLRHKV